MAYVRRRGRQLAIVHGARDRATGKVDQRTLHTFYSQEEVREALTRDEREICPGFRYQLEVHNPDICFDWAKLRAGLEQGWTHLPATYAGNDAGVAAAFGAGIAAFARQVVLADAPIYPEVWRAAVHHLVELVALEDLMAWRMEGWLEGESPPDSVVPRVRAVDLADVPPDVEERGVTLMEEGRLDDAWRWFVLLVAAFPRYADGHVFLGTIAEEQGRVRDAISHFQNAAKVGRANLPARVAKQRWWSDHATRPYIRGLRGLARAYLLAGEAAEALLAAAKLEACGDEIYSSDISSMALLARGEWADARSYARRIQELDPTASLTSAFASYELGDHRGAFADFAHATLNAPLTVAEVLGPDASRGFAWVESGDVASSAVAPDLLRTYFDRRGQDAHRFFMDLWVATAPLRAELSAALQTVPVADHEKAFRNRQRLQSLAYARKWASSRA